MPSADTLAFVFKWQLLLPMILAGMFGGVWLLSFLSGGRTLSRRFAALIPIDGERFPFASARMGKVPWFMVNYGACLTVTLSSTGISMAMIRPFGFLCREFCIPWAEVESVEERASALSRATVVRIRGSSVKLALRGQAGRSLPEYAARFGAGYDPKSDLTEA